MTRPLHKEQATMQKTPTAAVNTASGATTMAHCDKDIKDVFILGALILFVALVVAALWYYSQADETAHSNRSLETMDSAQVSRAFKTTTDNASVSTSVAAAAVTGVPVATRSTDILHDDIQFEIGRQGLSDDGRAALRRHAEFLKGEPDWGILLTGHTDQQGSISFNKILGLKRAEAVKQQLLTLGVPEESIRTVSMGEEGALCIDNSDVCRRMNRRVHLEMRKIGQEHLVIQAATAQPKTGPLEPVTNQSIEAEEIGSTAESLPPSEGESVEPITGTTTDN
jgi:peptidoglycan-associated lipoprotein